MAKSPRLKLSAESLETLGASRLAVLLMDIAESDKNVARLLRLALAGTEGSGRLKTELEKRLRAIARSRKFLDWDKVHALADELDSLRQMISGSLAEADTNAAVTQMQTLIGLAAGVFDRCDDSNGTLGRVFERAGADLGTLWGVLPEGDKAGLPQQICDLLEADEHVILIRLMEAASPALGPEGRSALRRLLQQRLPRERTGKEQPGSMRDYRRDATSERLMELADIESDVAEFIAAVESSTRPDFYAAEVARRLIAASRYAEARTWLDRAPVQHEEQRALGIDLRLTALDALGRKPEALDLRWWSFCESLNATHLRAYLGALPDFEDAKAEDRAIAHAMTFHDHISALTFLVAWPNLSAADSLVHKHHATLNARDYKRLRPIAEALSEKYPGSATLLHRRLIEDVLTRAASLQYQYAMRDLRMCAALAPDCQMAWNRMSLFLSVYAVTIRVRRASGIC